MKKSLFFGLIFVLLVSCIQNKTSMEDKDLIIDNILTRRSIRKFATQQVGASQLDVISKCAVYSPSALNKQPWEVRIIQNSDILADINNRFLEYAKGKTLSGSASKASEPGFSIFHHAPTLIVIGKDKSNNFSSIDCGIITQNILLSAHALGLGTCPIGSLAFVFNDEINKDLWQTLNMPNTHDFALCIALGYPDEQPVAKDRDFNKVQIIN